VEGVRQAATAVAVARRQAAPGLAAAVEARLQELALAGARFDVAVGGDDPADDIEFLLGPNPGEPLLPLAKTASGGELARAMLALRLVLTEGPPTLVFDEVDAGVGGQAAVEIGRRLARLARTHQVLAVTHLPQVAAFADRHLVVAKDTSGAITTSGVRIVEETERSRELARMLAGLPDSDLGIAHAEELLAVASKEKHR
jgi:DNA repair protein RecN (Recombination protein N)